MKNQTLLTCMIYFLVAGNASLCLAQLQASDAYFFRYRALTEDVYQFDEPAFFTSFNRGGYNNQPCFFNEEELYLTIGMADGNSQTDIYAFNFSKGEMRRVTATHESEYSPKPIPGKESFSVVRVSSKDTTKQLFWEYPLSGGQDGRLLWDGSTQIAYYHWIGPDQFITQVLGEPNQLLRVNLKSGSVDLLTTNIGRSFAILSDKRIGYVQKEGNQASIMAFNPQDSLFSPEKLINTQPGSEDFIGLQTGEIVMGNGSKLYKYRHGWDTEWKEIADFSAYQIRNITRLAEGPGQQLILINQPSAY